jgi:hypothetical protein
VVLPALPALLGGLEELPPGFEVKVLGDLIPLSPWVQAEYNRKYG